MSILTKHLYVTLYYVKSEYLILKLKNAKFQTSKIETHNFVISKWIKTEDTFLS